MAQISEALRALNFDRHEDAYDTAMQLRRAADRIEHAAGGAETLDTPVRRDHRLSVPV